MRMEGFLAPETVEEARDTYSALSPPAAEVTRSVALALGIDAEDYRERVDDAVIEVTREALFGSLLLVRTADRDGFDTWIGRPEHDDLAVTVEGGDHVDNVAWHLAPLVDEVIAATYAEQRSAAVSTLRRIAWARIYRECLLDGGSASD